MMESLIYYTGLEKDEIDVYFAILDLGRPTIKAIQDKIKDHLNLSYSQTYYIIQKLKKAGMIEEHSAIEHNFTAINPAIYLNDLRNKQIHDMAKFQTQLVERYKAGSENFGQCTIHTNHFHFSSLELGIEIIIDKMIQPAHEKIVFLANPSWIFKKLKKSLIDAYDRGVEIEIHYSKFDFEEITDYISQITPLINDFKVEIFNHRYRCYDALAFNDEYTRMGHIVIDLTRLIDLPYYFHKYSENGNYGIDFLSGFYQIPQIAESVLNQLQKNPILSQNVCIPQNEAQLLNFLKNRKEITKSELAKDLEISGKKLNILLNRLRGKNQIIIEKRQNGPGRPTEYVKLFRQK